MADPQVAVALSGSDDVLVSAARTDLVAALVDDGDSTLLVTDLAGEDYEMGELVDAAQTPPFLTDRRIVVGRDLHRFSADDYKVLIAYLADPLPTTTLVLEWGGSGRVPKAVSEAIKAAGGEVRSTGPGRKVAEFVRTAVDDAGLAADGGAVSLMTDWLGDDAGKLPGLLALLASTYGAGARLRAVDIEPFLTDAGGVPPWDLTDAIDKGDIAGALGALRRMLGAGRHPLQVMASLHTHFQRILRLDGAGVRTETEAASLLGMKGSTFPARKAMGQARRLGSAGAKQSITLLAAADLDIRGQVDWPGHLVMEVLVARLARVARGASAAV